MCLFLFKSEHLIIIVIMVVTVNGTNAISWKGNDTLAKHVVYYKVYLSPMVGFIKHYNIVMLHTTVTLHTKRLQFLSFKIEVQIRIYPCPHL